MKFDMYFSNMSRKLKFRLKLTRITGTLHEDQYTFVIVFRSLLLTMRNDSDKSCRENQNIYCIQFFESVPFMRKRGKIV